MTGKIHVFLEDIISSLLFVNGDSMHPLAESTKFVQNFLLGQLKIILKSANDNRIARNATKLEFIDFLVQAKKHPNLMKRFLLRIKTYDEAMKVRNLYNSLKNIDYDCEDYSSYKNILSTTDDEGEELSKSLESILEKMDGCEEYIDFIKNGYKFTDNTKQKIMKKKEERTKSMSTDEYILFENNRSKTLFSTASIKRARHKQILEMIDPQFDFSTLSLEAIHSLNFIVSEILSILVAQATEIRSHILKNDSFEYYEPISLDYYKLALKKTTRYMKTGNYLFGVID
uniref:Transcription initiation factor TFIID subunit 4 n=1 Tax=Strongyloides venezuelensis TaxID=75913 RepID=A0A0K0FU97_STRVS